MVEYSFGMIVAIHERQAGLQVVYFGLFITNHGFMQCDWFPVGALTDERAFRVTLANNEVEKLR